METMEASKTSDFSILELKELFIEWALRKSPPDCMGYELPAKSRLESMMVLDTDELDVHDNTSLFTGGSIKLNFEHEHVEERRMAFLQTVLGSLETSVRVQVKQAFEEELKALGLVKSLGDKVQFSQKAMEIAVARALAKNFGDGNTQLNTEKKYDFKVLVNRLRGGYGSNMDIAQLYFGYKTEFWSFLEMLQETTSFSTIPPVDLEKQYHIEEEIDFSRSTSSWLSEPSSIASSTSQGSTNTQLDPSLGLVDEMSASSTELTRGSTDTPARGYTLEHGPWLWRINWRDLKARKREPWHKITGLTSYNKMINTAREESKNNGCKPLTIAVCHTLDKGAIDQWYRIQAAERREERDYKENMREQGFDDEEIGEPYFQWLLAGQNAMGGSRRNSSHSQFSNVVAGSHHSPSQRTRSDPAENGA